MPEIDVKFSQITPSAQSADTATQLVGVQAGASDLLYNVQQLQSGPFTSNVAARATTPAGATPTARSPANRASDYINVKDFGATGNGITDDWAALQSVFTSNLLTTSGTTSTSSTTLVFPPNTIPAWITPGMTVANTSNPSALFGGGTITAINVGAGTITISATPAQTIVIGNVMMFGSMGKVFFPPGVYAISRPLTLPSTPAGTPVTPPQMIIEGPATIKALAPFNGFLFDDIVAAGQSTHPQPGPWAMRGLTLSNNYKPTKIWKPTLAAAQPWLRNDATVVITNASIDSAANGGIAEGAILFANPGTSTFKGGSVPGYIGYVAIGGVSRGATNTTLTLGDALNGGGAQIPSGTATNTITLAGSVWNPGDTIRFVFTNPAVPALAAGYSPATYTVVGGDNANTVMVKLDILLRADTTLTSNGILSQIVTAGTTTLATDTINQGGALAATLTVTAVTSFTGGQTLTFSPNTGKLVFTDTIFAVQGFFANSTWTTAGNATAGGFSSTTITMLDGNPGLDQGNYYIWDFTKVVGTAANPNPAFIIPQCVGVTASVSNSTVPGTIWSGTSLALTTNANTASFGPNDLLVASPISGGVRHVSTFSSEIHQCNISGVIPISFDAAGVTDIGGGTTGGWFNKVSETTVANGAGISAAIGSIGITGGQGLYCENCDTPAFWIGIRPFGVNTFIVGGRGETCCYGVVIGGIVHANPNNTAQSGLVLMNTEYEGVWTCGVMSDGSSYSDVLLSSVIISGNHQNSAFGFYINTAGRTTIMNCQFSGAGVSTTQPYGAYWNPAFAANKQTAAIHIADASVNEQYLTFIDCQADCGPMGSYNIATGQMGVSWRMPTFPGVAQFINCNNPIPAYPFANLPAAQGGLTGQISADGTGTGAAGKKLFITAGTITPRTLGVGYGLKGANFTSPGGLLTLTSSVSTNTTQGGQVDIAQTAASGAITAYPVADGEEYYISDSPIPYTPIFTASGPGTISVSSSISLTVNVPGYITGDMTIFNDTTNQIIGTVRSPSLGPPYSGTVIQLNGTASSSWSGGDTILFRPLTNAGAAVTVGGGTNIVKVRWVFQRQNWIIA